MYAPNILIVEDEAIVALDLRQHLEDMGYGVAGIAENATDAIALAESTAPALTLMDISLKGDVSGIEAAETLAREHQIPVVFLTSFSDRETVRKAARAEPFGYLTKPFQAHELHATIEVALYKAQMERRLRESEQRFRSMFESAPLGIALLDKTTRYVEANPAFRRMLGYEGFELDDPPPDTLSHPDDNVLEMAALSELDSGGNVVQFEKRFRHRNQPHTLWTLVNAAPLRERSGSEGYLYQIQDLTERKNAERQLAQLAYFDPLTGIGNRARLQQQLEVLLTTAKRARQRFALVFMDVDNFKHVNDNLGHMSGDGLLKVMAERLQDCVRESDLLARIGGDEFVLVLTMVEEAVDVLVIAQKVAHALGQPIWIDGREIVSTVSMGVSLYPDDGDDIHALMQRADTALYAAKADGRNCIRFFKPSFAFHAWRRMEVEHRLRHALENRELFLDYQPIIDLRDGRPVAFEALLRWRSEGNLMRPDLFVPIAEDIGLIQEIGAWVLVEACRFAASWPAPLVIHVNCSARQFEQDSFIDEVAAALRDSGLAPERLCLELTEGIILNGNDQQIARVKAIKALGPGISIDDYGTGYSSLLYLKRYAPANLKIDKAFVSDLESNPNSATIVSTTIAMSHALGIAVVAEGVETQAQADYLREAGCNYAQGFLFSRPLSIEAAVAFIEASPR
ncbi:MAG TPA: EAL domain-containing protein [Rhodocyclaceae bacterium]|nr:EAL domain-containing protein [Rhodocyclaceae bacterium]